MKNLTEMTLEELWQLFPIVLTEHKDEWSMQYAEAERELRRILPQRDIKITHIGSTAITGIMAKPIVDILVEIPREYDMSDICDLIIKDGWTVMSESKSRVSFNKGYTPNGYASKVFHLHLRYCGDNDELYFRTYMNEHPELAREYEALKCSLQKTYKHNRDAYTEAKTEFITKYTRLAKAEYNLNADVPRL